MRLKIQPRYAESRIAPNRDLRHQFFGVITTFPERRHLLHCISLRVWRSTKVSSEIHHPLLQARSHHGTCEADEEVSSKFTWERFFGTKEQSQPLISQQRVRDVSGYQTRTQRSRVTCTQDCTLPVDRSIIVARVCETRDWNVYQSFQDRLNAWYVNTFPIDLPKIAWLVLGPPGFPGCLPP